MRTSNTYKVLLFTCSIIMSVRETCADWIRGIEPHDDPALKGNINLLKARATHFIPPNRKFSKIQ